MRFRPRRFLALSLLLLLAGSVLPPALAAGGVHGFQVRLHYQLPDGTEELGIIDDFQFVYYERRFAKKPTGFGKPGRVEIRDLPHEKTALQNEDGKKVKFRKLEEIRFDYEPVEGGRRLLLIATLKGKKKKIISWPASSLRNTSVARPPNFRGTSGGKEVDVPLPPLEPKDRPAEKLLTSIDFKFPGQKKHRDWF